MFKNQPRVNGFLTGLLVTILGVLWFFVISPDSPLEYNLYDVRVRNCNTLEPTPPIVHIDIDDNSLDRVGRWPWPRADLADVIRALNELGAELIAVDILLSEHEAPIVTDPRYARDGDVEPDVTIVGELSDENVVFGDRELANAIRTGGNVYIPVQLGVRGLNETVRVDDQLASLLDEQVDLTDGVILQRLQLQPTPENRDKVAKARLRHRVQKVLRREFTRTDLQLAEELGVSPAEIVDVVAGAKLHVARERVGEIFREDPDVTLDVVLDRILGDSKDRENADRADVVSAYRSNLGMQQVYANAHTPSRDVSSQIITANSAEPPYFLLAEAARGIAAVNFQSDSDGATRRVPLLVNYKNHVVKHLGFAVACDVLGLDADSLSFADDRTLIVPFKDGSDAYVVPLDENGNLIIPWTKTAKDWRDFADFRHVSAAKVWALVDARRQMHQNTIAINYHYADLIATSKGEVTLLNEGDAEAAKRLADSPYRRRVNNQLHLARQVHLHRLNRDMPEDTLAKMQSEADQLLAEIKHEQVAGAANIELMCSQIAQMPQAELDADPELKRDAERFLRAGKILSTDVAALEAANAKLAETVESLKQELAREIRGSYVFLGFAATAAGDIVTTPVDPRTNGVMCHAQVFNAFLQNHFIRRAEAWMDVLICLALGAVASLVTAAKGPRYALLGIAGLMIAYTAFNCFYLFMGLQLWFSLASVLVTVFVTWAIVTLFRQLTAERDRRFFAKQLSQYTSPAIAEKIAESPEAAKAFKAVQTRDVTCFFSDLKGFTTITEKEDAEVVQHVLNTYLERMSQVIWSQRGLINKFMGDGIMAFFNPSVDPLPEHAAIACETSLLTLQELRRLKEDERNGPHARIFDQLHMRVGLASGLCKNGDMGSELKADYTVIGDVVNLAARLEPANKVFGTQIMVSGPTMEAVKDRYAFRYLAELQVKGKAQTVPVYEIVCRKEQLTDEEQAYIERFEAGVELYKRREWDACIVHFTRLLSKKFDDAGASRYIDACQELKLFPPDDAWAGALELKEK